MTIAEQFKEFRSAYIPKDASQIQVDEMRRAFYSGVISCLKSLSEGDNDVTPLIEEHESWLARGGLEP